MGWASKTITNPERSVGSAHHESCTSLIEQLSKSHTTNDDSILSGERHPNIGPNT